MLKILSIGNSFSVDATRYLHRIASSCGMQLRTENLYIGGCSLKTHYENLLEDAQAYELFVNGDSTGQIVGIKEMLQKEKWDYITLQQASRFSVNYTTYQPFLNVIAQQAKALCPDAKLVIHQTWAYEDGSQLLCEDLGYEKAEDMFADIKASYTQAAADINAFGTIPSGELMRKLLQNGMPKVHRDTFHASLGAGRYALALLWYKFLTGNSIDAVGFCDFDEPVLDSELEIIRKSINEIL